MAKCNFSENYFHARLSLWSFRHFCYRGGFFLKKVTITFRVGNTPSPCTQKLFKIFFCGNFKNTAHLQAETKQRKFQPQSEKFQKPFRQKSGAYNRNCYIPFIVFGSSYYISLIQPLLYSTEVIMPVTTIIAKHLTVVYSAVWLTSITCSLFFPL